MRVDLHVHTSERSVCAQSSESEMIHAALAAGLDAIAFTDHDWLTPPEHLAMLNAKYAPFRIFPGIEVTLDPPTNHIVVLGMQDKALESGNWSYSALHAFVREREGFLIVAHPFRWSQELGLDVKTYPPDAIEVASNNTPRDAAHRIRRLAARLKIPVLSNSDAHHTMQLGLHYNQLHRVARNADTLFEILRAGEFKAQGPG
ncbi:MAG: PHP-associated domain-containing protein [Anaerolineales bacterium]